MRGLSLWKKKELPEILSTVMRLKTLCTNKYYEYHLSNLKANSNFIQSLQALSVRVSIVYK